MRETQSCGPRDRDNILFDANAHHTLPNGLDTLQVAHILVSISE